VRAMKTQGSTRLTKTTPKDSTQHKKNQYSFCPGCIFMGRKGMEEEKGETNTKKVRPKHKKEKINGQIGQSHWKKDSSNKRTSSGGEKKRREKRKTSLKKEGKNLETNKPSPKNISSADSRFGHLQPGESFLRRLISIF